MKKKILLGIIGAASVTVKSVIKKSESLKQFSERFQKEGEDAIMIISKQINSAEQSVCRKIAEKINNPDK